MHYPRRHSHTRGVRKRIAILVELAKDDFVSKGILNGVPHPFVKGDRIDITVEEKYTIHPIVICDSEARLSIHGCLVANVLKMNVEGVSQDVALTWLLEKTANELHHTSSPFHPFTSSHPKLMG